MAETAVNIVIDKLVPLVKEEVSVLGGVQGEINFIKNQLELIQAYIKDADEKAERAETSSVVKVWVKQVREVAYRMQDIVDQHLFNIGKQRIQHSTKKQEEGGGYCSWCCGVVWNKTGDLVRNVMWKKEMVGEIGEIREMLVRLNQAKETFGFNPSESAQELLGYGGISSMRMMMRHDPRKGARFLGDDELVGVDHVKGLLNGWIDDAGETRRTVISVVGEGGLGKTTVVNNVYKKQREERSFDTYAWITVTRSLNSQDLLKSTMQAFCDYDGNKSGASEMNQLTNLTALTNKLRHYLRGRRYMVVFDDVWNIDFWRVVEFALPDDNVRSRIMITTRDRGVAEFCTHSAIVHIHELKPLPPQDSLKLFHLKAFQFGDVEGCPQDLMGLSLEFVSKCNGVPLAIVAIGGLLSTKRKVASEWTKVLHSLHSKMSNDPHLRSYFQVLSESYNDLPYHLKLCLLYFGLFPEDYSVSCLKLIHLWIAEGFVKKDVNEDQVTLEEIAEEYLDELIRRSLIILSEVYRHGRVRKCMVHDLMHDFILKKCSELSFCQVKKNEDFEFYELTRRLSIHSNNVVNDDDNGTNFGKLRSCFVFNCKEFSKPMIERLVSSFKLLVGLDLEDAPIDYLPKTIGNLFYLKYLNLRSTNIKSIPKSIGKLENLETLDLKDSQVRELPIEINKLVKLRRLIAYSYRIEETYSYMVRFRGVKLHEGIGHLKALQKLSHVDLIDDDGDGVINELKNLKQLRRDQLSCQCDDLSWTELFSIVGLRRNQGILLCSAIESMTQLSSLSIAAAKEDEVLNLESINDPPQTLERLYLDAHLEKLPTWIFKLRHLVKLRLSWSGLMEDPVDSVLKNLPELLELRLSKAYEGEVLHFKDGCLRKLKNMEFENMQGLRVLKIDKGALPKLEELTIEQCEKLIEVPCDVQNLEALKLLDLVEMPDHVIDCLKSREEEVYDRIKEVTVVTYIKEGIYHHTRLINL